MPTYKPRQVMRDLLKKGCIYIRSNRGSHQKIRNPANGLTAPLAIHQGKDLKDYEVKSLYEQLGLQFDL